MGGRAESDSESREGRGVRLNIYAYDTVASWWSLGGILSSNRAPGKAL